VNGVTSLLMPHTQKFDFRTLYIKKNYLETLKNLFLVGGQMKVLDKPASPSKRRLKTGLV